VSEKTLKRQAEKEKAKADRQTFLELKRMAKDMMPLVRFQKQ
jgi:hypothetical protein